MYLTEENAFINGPEVVDTPWSVLHNLLSHDWT